VNAMAVMGMAGELAAEHARGQERFSFTFWMRCTF